MAKDGDTPHCASTVVVVLGAAVRPDGTLSVAMRRRVSRAVREVRARPGARLLLSGGRGKRHPPGVPSEARLMATLARESGVAAEALLLEEVSGNTLENAVHGLALIRAQGLVPAALVLVTDETHLRRALWCFRRAARVQGAPVTVEGVAVRIASPRVRAVAAFWETLALMLYAGRLARRRRLVAPVVAPGGAGHDGRPAKAAPATGAPAQTRVPSPPRPEDPTQP
ncbi:YdcF family protein [Roseospira navarrensis]|nr:YdcF family protein [Roseospira navarrensis]